MADAEERQPLVILGFDAGDPDLLHEWAADGTLPTLRGLMERGCWGRTSGPEMISEHGMWSSLVSGVSRGSHGYYYFRQLVPGTYRLAPVRGRHLGVQPFWDDLAPDAKVAIVDVPDIAEPRARPGIQLSEWATHYPYFAPSAHPPDALAAVQRIFGAQMVIDEKPVSTEQDDRSIYARLRRRVDKKRELCNQLLSKDTYDVVCVVFGECHTGGHQLWKYRRRGDSPMTTGAPDLKDGIRELYRAIDGAMGEIINRAGDHANVFVISSVGMKSQYPAAGLGEAFCRQLGYQAAPVSSHSASNSPTAFLRRVLPQSVRNQMSRMLSRETQERLISEKFEGATDWDRTEAFCIPSYYTSYIRVNLAGREPRGIVKPGAEYERLLGRLEEDFRLLIDPVTSKPAVKYLARAIDLFGGGPPEVLPDLFVEWAEADHFMTRVVHPRAELRQTACEFHRDSDHSREGFIAAAGPRIHGRGDIGAVSPLTLAPTFLHLLDVSEHRRGQLHDKIVGVPR